MYSAREISAFAFCFTKLFSSLWSKGPPRLLVESYSLPPSIFKSSSTQIYMSIFQVFTFFFKEEKEQGRGEEEERETVAWDWDKGEPTV